MPIADTSFVIDLLRRDPAALELYGDFERQGIALQTTAVTALELYKGASASGNEEDPRKVSAILELFTVIPVDEAVYEAFGRVSALLARGGGRVGDFDGLVAAIALIHDGEIITRDRHFENIPQLMLIPY